MSTLHRVARLSKPLHRENRRGFLLLGLAVTLSGCAHVHSPAAYGLNWDSIRRGDQMTVSGPIFERVSRVGRTVLAPPERGYLWQFGVENGNIPSVTAYDGNGISISTAMIEVCENDGQLGAKLVQAAMILMLIDAQGEAATSTFPNAETNMKADLAAIIALAKAGYDPRDALIITRRVCALEGDDDVSARPRLAAMESELRRLGYQV